MRHFLAHSFLPAILLFAAACTSPSTPDTEAAAAENHTDTLAHHPIAPWFAEARFGIFVHYAVNGHFAHYKKQLGDPADSKFMSRAVFERGAEDLTITAANVAEWAKDYKDWGARYAVLTASQHPGFALWDTEHNDRNIVDMGPNQLDLVDAWCTSLRDEGLRVGLYFNHEDRGHQGLMEVLEDTTVTDKRSVPAWNDYLALRDKRVEELVSNYGDIDLLWFDADWIAQDAEELGTEPLVDMIVQYQPDVVMNNRLRSRHHGHYGTPEKYIPVTDLPQPFEVCDNLSNSTRWGYIPSDTPPSDYRTAKEMIFTAAQSFCRGGNFLLNVGPKPDGSLPTREREIMDSVGAFVNQNAEAIFGTSQGLPYSCYGGGSTFKPGALYLFSDQNGGHLHVLGLHNAVVRATDLATGQELHLSYFGGRPKVDRPEVLRVDIPANTTGLPRVFKLELEGDTLRVQNK